MQVRVTCPGTEGETETWGLYLAHAQEAGMLGAYNVAVHVLREQAEQAHPKGQGKCRRNLAAPCVGK